MSDHLKNAVPAYGNPNYRGVGSQYVLATNASFESAQAGVVPYASVSFTEIDEDLFAENDVDWVIEDNPVPARKVGRPRKET